MRKTTEAEVSINGVCGTICAADELTTAVGVLKKRNSTSRKNEHELIMASYFLRLFAKNHICQYQKDDKIFQFVRDTYYVKCNMMLIILRVIRIE